jgi:hypothetical protein
MSKRAYVLFLIMDCLDLVLFLGCWTYLKNNPGSGPEGLGIALLAYASLFASVFLAGFCINEIINENRRGGTARRTLAVTLFSASPIIIYLLLDVLPRRIRSAH